MLSGPAVAVQLLLIPRDPLCVLAHVRDKDMGTILLVYRFGPISGSLHEPAIVKTSVRIQAHNSLG
jgi:hypothetical protein